MHLEIIESLCKLYDVLCEDRDRYFFKKKEHDFIYKQLDNKCIELSNIIDLVRESEEKNKELINKLKKSIELKNEEIEKLIGVCLFHGINDLDYYMKFKLSHIIDFVKESRQYNYRQTPFDIWKFQQGHTTKHEQTVTKPVTTFKDYEQKERT